MGEGGFSAIGTHYDEMQFKFPRCRFSGISWGSEPGPGCKPLAQWRSDGQVLPQLRCRLASCRSSRRLPLSGPCGPESRLPPHPGAGTKLTFYHTFAPGVTPLPQPHLSLPAQHCSCPLHPPAWGFLSWPLKNFPEATLLGATWSLRYLPPSDRGPRGPGVTYLLPGNSKSGIFKQSTKQAMRSLRPSKNFKQAIFGEAGSI